MSDRPTAIITGASSGIGRAIALALAEQGYGTTITGRSKEGLAETTALMPPESAHQFIADLADLGTPERLVESAIDKWGNIDVLVNNAGIAPLAMVAETESALITDAIKVNAIAPARLVAALWQHWVERGAGCLINISSLAGSDPFPGFLAYGMSKAALDSLTRSVHVEGASAGIRAFSLALGAVETKMLRSIVTVEQYPSDQTLTPEAVAAKVLELIAGSGNDLCGTSIPFSFDSD